MIIDFWLIVSIAVTFGLNYLFSALSKRFKNKLVKLVTRFFSFVMVLLLALTPIVLLFQTLELIFFFVRFLFIKLFGNTTASNYLTLTTFLITAAYFPDLVKNILLLLKKTNEAEAFSRLIKFLRIKLLIFLTSFILTLVSPLESIFGHTLFFMNQIWIQIKPVVPPSVLSFIAFERFMKLFEEERKDLGKEIKQSLFNVRCWLDYYFKL